MHSTVATAAPAIRLASSADALNWDYYVLQHTGSPPYHLYAWKEAVEQAYGFKAYYVLAFAQERIVGVLPLFFLTSPLGPGQLVALPYCDIGGPLADNVHIAMALFDYAVHLGARLHAKRLDVRGFGMAAALQAPGCMVEKKQDKVRMILSLPGSEEELWQGFKSKLRSQINKAKKNGLTFSFCTDLDEFYLVFSQNMHELGSPVHSYRWFQAIFASYGNRARLGLVFKGDQAIGGGIVLNTDNDVSIPWASTLRKYNYLSPNMLLYWHLLEDSVRRGFSTFDFGRSTPGEGTYRFKAQWGARPVPLDWHIVKFSKGRLGKNAPPCSRPEDAIQSRPTKRMIAAKLWSLLPAWVVNRTGPVLRKYISL